MQAIRTKYLAPTNTRGARFKASCEAGSITICSSYNNADVCHLEAAKALMAKLGWDKDSDLVSGGLDDGTYAHCLISKSK